MNSEQLRKLKNSFFEDASKKLSVIFLLGDQKFIGKFK